MCNFCDYFIICSGENTTQVRAIYDWVIEKSKELNLEIHHSEIDTSARWLLVDFYDIILHIFLEEARDFYNLEYLWREAKKVRQVRKRKS